MTVNYYDGTEFSEVATVEDDQGNPREAYRWDGSQWVRIWPTIPDSGASRWTFDDADTSGSTAIDVWGDNDASISGATTGQSGVATTWDSGESYSFDGTDDIVDTGISSLSSPLSIALWADLGSDTLTDEALFTNYESGSSDLYIMAFDNNGKINWAADDYNYSQDPGNGVTFFGLGVDSNGNVTFRLNNTTVDTGTTNNSSWSSGLTYSIGGSNFASQKRRFDGRIDDVRIYNKALSETEWSDLYNTGKI